MMIMFITLVGIKYSRESIDDDDDDDGPSDLEFIPSEVHGEEVLAQGNLVANFNSPCRKWVASPVETLAFSRMEKSQFIILQQMPWNFLPARLLGPTIHA